MRYEETPSSPSPSPGPSMFDISQSGHDGSLASRLRLRIAEESLKDSFICHKDVLHQSSGYDFEEYRPYRSIHERNPTGTGWAGRMQGCPAYIEASRELERLGFDPGMMRRTPEQHLAVALAEIALWKCIHTNALGQLCTMYTAATAGPSAVSSLSAILARACGDPVPELAGPVDIKDKLPATRRPFTMEEQARIGPSSYGKEHVTPVFKWAIDFALDVLRTQDSRPGGLPHGLGERELEAFRRAVVTDFSWMTHRGTNSRGVVVEVDEHVGSLIARRKDEPRPPVRRTARAPVVARKPNPRPPTPPPVKMVERTTPLPGTRGGKGAPFPGQKPSPWSGWRGASLTSIMRQQLVPTFLAPLIVVRRWWSGRAWSTVTSEDIATGAALPVLAIWTLLAVSVRGGVQSAVIDGTVLDVALLELVNLSLVALGLLFIYLLGLGPLRRMGVTPQIAAALVIVACGMYFSSVWTSTLSSGPLVTPRGGSPLGTLEDTIMTAFLAGLFLTPFRIVRSYEVPTGTLMPRRTENLRPGVYPAVDRVMLSMMVIGVAAVASGDVGYMRELTEVFAPVDRMLVLWLASAALVLGLLSRLLGSRGRARSTRQGPTARAGITARRTSPTVADGALQATDIVLVVLAGLAIFIATSLLLMSMVTGVASLMYGIDGLQAPMAMVAIMILALYDSSISGRVEPDPRLVTALVVMPAAGFLLTLLLHPTL